MPITLVCPNARCEQREWVYKGSRDYASCPRCKNKVKVEPEPITSLNIYPLVYEIRHRLATDPSLENKFRSVLDPDNVGDIDVPALLSHYLIDPTYEYLDFLELSRSFRNDATLFFNSLPNLKINDPRVIEETSDNLDALEKQFRRIDDNWKGLREKFVTSFTLIRTLVDTPSTDVE